MNKGDFITVCSNIYMRNQLGSVGMFDNLGELYNELTDRQEQGEAQQSVGVASKCGTANTGSPKLPTEDEMWNHVYNIIEFNEVLREKWKLVMWLSVVTNLCVVNFGRANSWWKQTGESI